MVLIDAFVFMWWFFTLIDFVPYGYDWCSWWFTRCDGCSIRGSATVIQIEGTLHLDLRWWWPSHLQFQRSLSSLGIFLLVFIYILFLYDMLIRISIIAVKSQVFEAVMQHFPTIAVSTLTTNYRSSQPLLDSARRLIITNQVLFSPPLSFPFANHIIIQNFSFFDSFLSFDFFFVIVSIVLKWNSASIRTSSRLSLTPNSSQLMAW